MDNLLEQFTIAKHTGLEKPGRWEVFSYESSLKHSPLKKGGATTTTVPDAAKPPQKLLIQSSSVSPSATSSQGKKILNEKGLRESARPDCQSLSSSMALSSNLMGSYYNL